MELTIKEAYLTMFFYLDAIYNRTKSDDLGMILSEMIMLADGKPADPAVWNDWLKSISKDNPQNETSMKTLTIKQAFAAMRYYVAHLFNFSFSKDIQNIFKDLYSLDDGMPLNETVKKNYLAAVHKAKSLVQ